MFCSHEFYAQDCKNERNYVLGVILNILVCSICKKGNLRAPGNEIKEPWFRKEQFLQFLVVWTYNSTSRFLRWDLSEVVSKLCFNKFLLSVRCWTFTPDSVRRWSENAHSAKIASRKWNKGNYYPNWRRDDVWIFHILSSYCKYFTVDFSNYLNQGKQNKAHFIKLHHMTHSKCALAKVSDRNSFRTNPTNVLNLVCWKSLEY